MRHIWQWYMACWRKWLDMLSNQHFGLEYIVQIHSRHGFEICYFMLWIWLLLLGVLRLHCRRCCCCWAANVLHTASLGLVHVAASQWIRILFRYRHAIQLWQRRRFVPRMLVVAGADGRSWRFTRSSLLIMRTHKQVASSFKGKICQANDQTRASHDRFQPRHACNAEALIVCICKVIRNIDQRIKL